MLVGAVVADASDEEQIFLHDRYRLNLSFVNIGIKLSVHPNGLQRWRDKFCRITAKPTAQFSTRLKFCTSANFSVEPKKYRLQDNPDENFESEYENGALGVHIRPLPAISGVFRINFASRFRHDRISSVLLENFFV